MDDFKLENKCSIWLRYEIQAKLTEIQGKFNTCLEDLLKIS